MAGRDAPPDDDRISEALALLDSLPDSLLLGAGLDRGSLREELGEGRPGA